jgi:hypothetical protein
MSRETLQKSHYTQKMSLAKLIKLRQTHFSFVTEQYSAKVRPTAQMNTK